jgi:hypothetical protein
MSLKTWYRKKSILFQTLFGLIPTSIAIFAIAIGILVGLNITTQNRLIDGANEILENDVIDQTKSILGEKTTTLLSLINQNDQGFLQLVGNTIEYTYNPSNYSLPPVKSFPDNDLSDLDSPLKIISRSGGHPVSLSASGVFIPGQLADGINIPALMLIHEDIINRTSHIDFYCKCLFKNYTDVAAVYYGDDDSGMFRRYPGASSKLFDPTRSYDPRLRQWYIKAKSASNDITISDPYLDAFGLGWMITISFRIKDMDGNVIGVVGLDMLIDTISDNILSFQFEGSHSHLIQKNGIVLSSPEWTPVITSGTLFMVTDITTPVLEDTWTTIKSIGQGHFKTDTFIVIYKDVVIGDQTYYYVTAVPKDNALSVVKQHEDGLKKKINEANTTVVGILLATLVIVIIIVVLSTYQMTSTIRSAKQLMKRAGTTVASGCKLQNLSNEIGDVLRNTTQRNETNNFGRSVGLSLQGQIMTQEDNTFQTGSDGRPMVPTAPPAGNSPFGVGKYDNTAF